MSVLIRPMRPEMGTDDVTFHDRALSEAESGATTPPGEHSTTAHGTVLNFAHRAPISVEPT